MGVSEGIGVAEGIGVSVGVGVGPKADRSAGISLVPLGVGKGVRVGVGVGVGVSVGVSVGVEVAVGSGEGVTVGCTTGAEAASDTGALPQPAIADAQQRMASMQASASVLNARRRPCGLPPSTLDTRVTSYPHDLDALVRPNRNLTTDQATR